MIRFVKLLALAGITFGGAFLTTAAQASAANFNVSFAIHNADSTNSMIRNTTPLPSGVTGLINPPAAILPGGNDPAAGFATYSAGLPLRGAFASATLQYVNSGNSADECTFTIKVSNVGGVNPYLLHFASDQARCTVPADQQNASGVFTSTTSVVNWFG
jgi:hypothetical protein